MTKTDCRKLIMRARSEAEIQLAQGNENTNNLLRKMATEVERLSSVETSLKNAMHQLDEAVETAEGGSIYHAFLLPSWPRGGGE